MKVFTLTDFQNHILFLAKIKANQLDTGNSSTTGLTNLNNLINQWKDRTVEAHPFTWRVGRWTIKTNSRFSHDMPAGVQRVVTVFDVANERYLREAGLQAIRKNDPGLTTTGTPEVYTFPGTVSDTRQIGFWPVGGATLEVEFDRLFRDMDDVNDTFPLIGVPRSMLADFQAAVTFGVLSDVNEYLGKSDKSVANLAKHQLWVSHLIEADAPQNAREVLANHAPITQLREARLPSQYPVGS